ncbi:MAG: TolC family protein, partial [Bacteroidetes bacterium CG_4_8_14_3_um_filter_31_14]
RITLYAKQSDLAENSLNILITSFSANGTDFEEILRMENQLLDYELK